MITLSNNVASSVWASKKFKKQLKLILKGLGGDINMQLKIEKLDGRHNASRVYTHRVWIKGMSHDRKQNYIQLREWCWENFGPGCERDLIWYNKSSTYRWAFHYDQRAETLYIYLKEEVLTAFLLKWVN